MASRRSWHGYASGQVVALADVVAACRKRIESRGVIDVEGKRELVDVIAACGHPSIVFLPQRARGWGASPMNKNNWRTPDGEPVL